MERSLDSSLVGSLPRDTAQAPPVHSGPPYVVRSRLSPWICPSARPSRRSRRAPRWSSLLARLRRLRLRSILHGAPSR